MNKQNYAMILIALEHDCLFLVALFNWSSDLVDEFITNNSIQLSEELDEM